MKIHVLHRSALPSCSDGRYGSCTRFIVTPFACWVHVSDGSSVVTAEKKAEHCRDKAVEAARREALALIVSA